MLNSRHCMNPITYLPSLYYQMSKILNFAFLQWIFCICIFFHTKIICFGSVQSLSCVWLFTTPWTTARQASLSITNSGSLLKLIPIKSVMPSNHLILCCPLLLLPSIFPSIRVFSNESVLHIRWPKCWASALASVLPVDVQDWSPLGFTALISLQSKGISRVFSNTINSSVLSFLYSLTLTFIRDYWKKP